jgi:hypothetical protein
MKKFNSKPSPGPDKEISWSYKSGTKPIPGEVSRLLCKIIHQQTSVFDEKLAEYIDQAELEELKYKYLEKKKSVKNISSELPRLYIVYVMISEFYEDFKWSFHNERQKKTGKPIKKVLTNNYTADDGYLVSLGSFLLRRVNANPIERNMKRLGCQINHQNQSEIELAKFLTDISSNKISKEQFDAAHKWLLRAEQKGEAVLFTGICPDYANEPIGERRYRFTFDGLNDGIGVAAKRLVEHAHPIHHFFESKNIKVKHIAAIGDFEAFSSRILERVSETEASFIEKLKSSQKALKKCIGSELNLEYPLITEICGGKYNWHKKFYATLIRLNSGDFGNTGVNQKKLNSIKDLRRPLLERWFSDVGDQKLEEMVIWQAAEYATLSSIVHANYEDPLIIGVDHSIMLPFYNYFNQIAIFYLTSNYMENSK